MTLCVDIEKKKPCLRLHFQNNLKGPQNLEIQGLKSGPLKRFEGPQFFDIKGPKFAFLLISTPANI